MRYRRLSDAGDYVFGAGSAQFLINSAETVAQAVQTRLALWAGEWFLDLTEGTPYTTEILGAHTQGTYDSAIQDRILTTPGVIRITDYASVLNSDRSLAVAAKISTIYGDVSTLQVLG